MWMTHHIFSKVGSKIICHKRSSSSIHPKSPSIQSRPPYLAITREENMYSNDTKRKWGRKSLACLKHLCNPSGDGILSLSVGPWDIFYNEKKSKEFF